MDRGEGGWFAGRWWGCRENDGADDTNGVADVVNMGSINMEGDADGANVGDFVGALVGNGVAIPSIRPTNSTSPIVIRLLLL